MGIRGLEDDMDTYVKICGVGVGLIRYVFCNNGNRKLHCLFIH